MFAIVGKDTRSATLVEEPLGGSGGECLAIDRLVWVGAKAGAVHRKTPMPIALVAQTYAFRQPILQALGERNIPWCMVFESGSIDATQVTVHADLAVTVWLASTVPDDLDILPHGDLLPELLPIAIKLYQSDVVASRAVAALVQGVRVWRGLVGGAPRDSGRLPAVKPCQRPQLQEANEAGDTAETTIHAVKWSDAAGKATSLSCAMHAAMFESG